MMLLSGHTSSQLTTQRHVLFTSTIHFDTALTLSRRNIVVVVRVVLMTVGACCVKTISVYIPRCLSLKSLASDSELAVWHPPYRMNRMRHRSIVYVSCLRLFVNRITQKLLIKSLWNFMEWLDIIQEPIYQA